MSLAETVSQLCLLVQSVIMGYIGYGHLFKPDGNLSELGFTFRPRSHPLFFGCPLRFRLEPVIVFRPCTDIHIAAESDSFHVCELQVGGIKRTSIIAPALLRSSGGRCVNDVQI
jgi:hypothetical protein